ncbi:MAG TPA: NAD(P)H-dependent oxidoreductase [Acidobacteriaceae bacterium]|nr:NAD(P)H-dependent oxidoreductase [Acidobacteriaceae bacterium]
MPTLLRVDSSPMFQGSVSRQLTEEFVQRWRALHPDGSVISRDLNRTPLAPVTAQWVGAAYMPEESRGPEQKQILELSDTLIAELEAADEYVIGVPMHNFNIPSTAKLWIDLIARAGKTFTYAEGRPRGLLNDKKATFLVASGQKYDAGSPLAAYNFTEPYLRAFFAFLGVTQTIFINAGGTAGLRPASADRAAVLQPYVEAVAAQVV